MNDSKTKKSIISRDSTTVGNASNVSTYVKREEKTYVQSFAMTKKKRLDWIDNHLGGDDDHILHPSLREFKASEAAADPDRREKAKLLMICVGIALVMLLLIPAVKISASYLVIEAIRVEGSSLYSDAELLSAGGLNRGDGLPLLKASAAEEAILSNLPYVKSCDISFELPNVLIISIIDEAPALYANIEGENYVLTSSMRVLARASEEDELSGLLCIELPRVSKAVVGEEIVLEGTSVEYITEFFKLINESELNGRLGMVYFDKKFDIVASVDGKFRVMFGSPADMELKIASVSKMIEENGEKCLKAGIIDVRVTDICGITIDSDIDPNARE